MMGKPRGMFPCEMGQSCDDCDASQCPGISQDHKNAIFSEQKLKKFDDMNNPAHQWQDEYDDDEYDDFEDD